MTDIFAVGRLVTVDVQHDAPSPSGYGTLRLPVGAQGRITKVNADTLYVSFPRQYLLHPETYQKNSRYTATVTKSSVTPGAMDPAAAAEAAKPKRKLGQKPEGDEFIGPDHPGLQWLWEDVAKVAERHGYCGYYDQIADQVGVPGRLRDLRVTHKVDGMEFVVTVKAHSQKEANKIVAEKLAKVKA